MILTDTVGFIRKLPHRLIDAFKATLEEAVVADILLHVVDFSSSEYKDHLLATQEVLDELGAAEKDTIIVYNKIDNGVEESSRLQVRAQNQQHVFTSCKTNEGIDELLEMIEAKLNKSMSILEYLIPHHRYDLISKLRNQGSICAEEIVDTGVKITASPRGGLEGLLLEFKVV